MPVGIARGAGLGLGFLVVGLSVVCCAPPPPSILLIVVDTLRADHLGVYGYPLDTSPHLDRFAADNLIFRYAVSAAPWTSPSVASILTGSYPTAHGVMQSVVRGRMPTDAISGDFETLAEALQQAGYGTTGITANAWVSEERGFSQGFGRFVTLDYSNAKTVNESVFAEVRRLRDSEAPFFLYVHYMDPHPPMQPPPALAAMFLRARQRLGVEPGLGDTQARYVAAYDAEIRSLDTEIGALFQHLRELGLYDDLVIALVSDHGTQFEEHGSWGHGYQLHNEETHVPLLLKAADRAGSIDTTVSTVDLYPTLLDVAGAEWPDSVQGVSLLGDLEGRKARGVFSEVTTERNHKAFVSHDARKLVLRFAGPSHAIVSQADERGVVGLFDSRDDYAEREPLDDPEATARLRERFFEVYRGSVALGRSVRPATAELSKETLEELEKLGYVE